MTTIATTPLVEEDDDWEAEPPEIHLTGAVFALQSCLERASRPDLMACPQMAAIREAIRAAMVPLKKAMEELT